jgi:hypothetical protein
MCGGAGPGYARLARVVAEQLRDNPGKIPLELIEVQVP